MRNHLSGKIILSILMLHLFLIVAFKVLPQAAALCEVFRIYCFKAEPSVPYPALLTLCFDLINVITDMLLMILFAHLYGYLKLTRGPSATTSKESRPQGPGFS